MLGLVSAWRKNLLAIVLLSTYACAVTPGRINCDWQRNIGDNFDDWVQHGASCYKWIEQEDYWYPAEQSCIISGGHLVSINDETENTLVGRVTYCQATWTGRYGVNASQLGDADTYRWTDGTASSFNRHNFSRLTTPHQPLVTAEALQWYNNLYHARSSYVCKAPSSTPLSATGCSAGWHRMGDFCYLQPPFQATYIEAGFYCDGRQAHLVSVHTKRELRLLSLLDLSQATCSVEFWIGLVKLNPCRQDYAYSDSDSNNQTQQICYRWADRSGDHLGLPAWEAGHPIGDRITNCVVLKDRSLRSEPCHMRHSFVCKRPVRLATIEPPTLKPPTEKSTLGPPTRPSTNEPPTEKPPTRPSTNEPPTEKPPTRPSTEKPPTVKPPTEVPSTVQTRPTTNLPPNHVLAAYNFRRGLSNLGAQPGFRILDSSGITLGPEGAIMTGTTGILVDTESSKLTRPLKQGKNWTIFYMLKPAKGIEEILVDISGDKDEPSLFLSESRSITELTLYRPTGYFQDKSENHKDSQEPNAWVRVAVVFKAGRAYFYRNGADVSSHLPATSSSAYPDNDEHLMLGRTYQPSTDGYRGVLACFGVAHAALTHSELATAFQHYCDL